MASGRNSTERGGMPGQGGAARGFIGPASIVAVLIIVALGGCARPGNVAAGGCPPPEGTPSFHERTVEPLRQDARRADYGTLLVYVRRGGDRGALLEGAEVILHRADAQGEGVGIRGSATTDRIGLAMIDSVRPRRYRLDVRRIGYVLATGTVEIGAGRAHVIDVALARNLCGLPERGPPGQAGKP